MDDLTKVTKMFMAMAEMCGGSEKAKVDAQADILFRTPGIIKPDDWDDLPLEEKQRRIEKVKSVGL